MNLLQTTKIHGRKIILWFLYSSLIKFSSTGLCLENMGLRKDGSILYSSTRLGRGQTHVWNSILSSNVHKLILGFQSSISIWINVSLNHPLITIYYWLLCSLSWSKNGPRKWSRMSRWIIYWYIQQGGKYGTI